MLKKFFENTRRPEGLGGRIMLAMMNSGHASMARWGLSFLSIRPQDYILDIGCGGGANMAVMLQQASEGKVCGIDYSALSVEKAISVNQEAVAEGRAKVRQASVSDLPYDAETFDIVTAFETVYFWPDFQNDLLEVHRVLKPGGVFFICNEETRQDGDQSPAKGFEKLLSLNVYSPQEFHVHLTGAGFRDVTIHYAEKKSWLCVTAVKPKTFDPL